MLTNKAKDQEKLIKAFREKEEQYLDLEVEFNRMKYAFEKITEELQNTTQQNKNLQDKCHQIEGEKLTTQEDKEYLIGILGDAAEVLKNTLEVCYKLLHFISPSYKKK